MQKKINFYSKNNLRILSKIYLSGIIIGVSLGLIIIHKNLSSEYLLIEGLLHLVTLTFLGYTMQKPFEQIIAGSKIETAGYLHTIIGFFVAINLLDKGGDFDINNLLNPIASALLTSILGWLFGGEISGRGEKHQLQTRDEIITVFAQSSYEIKLMLQNTKIELRYLLNDLASTQKIYHDNTIQSAENYQNQINILTTTLTNNLSSFVTNIQQVNALIINSNTSLNSNLQTTNSIMNKNNVTLEKNLQEVNNIINNSSNSLQEINQKLTNLLNKTNSTASLMEKTSSHCEILSTSAETAANYLSNTQILMQQLESLTQYIISQRK